MLFSTMAAPIYSPTNTAVHEGSLFSVSLLTLFVGGGYSQHLPSLEIHESFVVGVFCMGSTPSRSLTFPGCVYPVSSTGPRVLQSRVLP